MKIEFEEDAESFPSEAYRVKSQPGVAWFVLGWEVEPDEETEWTGIKKRTGKVVAVMVGDDARYALDEDDLIPLPAIEYCHDCGQIGCQANVPDED